MNAGIQMVVAAIAPMTLALAASASAQLVREGAAPPNTSMTCRFQSGPLSGQVRDFSDVPGAKPFANGAPCTDGHDSYGVAVADKTTAAPSADRAGADTATRSDEQQAPSSCRFTVGPRTGESMDLRRLPKSERRPGAACADGKGSRGVVR
jgi:hypothetical protein